LLDVFTFPVGSCGEVVHDIEHCFTTEIQRLRKQVYRHHPHIRIPLGKYQAITMDQEISPNMTSKEDQTTIMNHITNSAKRPIEVSDDLSQEPVKKAKTKTPRKTRENDSTYPSR
jgi:hypothetical protein